MPLYIDSSSATVSHPELYRSDNIMFIEQQDQQEPVHGQQFFVYRAELQALVITLINHQLSNPDEIRYYLNILYPYIQEFSHPFTPTSQNRALLLGHLAHKIYIQLAMADPYHPYNDIINLQPVVFSQIPKQLNFLAYNMHVNMQASQYQAYIQNFIAANSRDLIINQDHIDLCNAEMEACYAQSELNAIEKLHTVLEFGAKILLVKLLLMIAEQRVFLPFPMLEQDVQSLNFILNELAENQFEIYADDYELFVKLAVKSGELYFLDKCLSLGARTKSTIDVLEQLKTKFVKPLLIIDKAPEPTMPIIPTLIVKDREYTEAEILSKIAIAIETLDGAKTNLLIGIYSYVWNTELCALVEQRIARVKKEGGKFTERTENLDRFIHTITPDIACWVACLINFSIHVRFKKMILELLLLLPVSEYIKAAKYVDFLELSERFLDRSVDREHVLSLKLERHDLAATLNGVALSTDLINPDGSTILHRWALVMPEKFLVLKDILTKYCKNPGSKLYELKFNNKTFVQIVASYAIEVQQNICRVLFEHQAFGQVAFKKELLKAVEAQDKSIVEMLCNIDGLIIDKEIMLAAASVPLCKDHAILATLCAKYNGPEKLTDISISTGFDMLAMSLFKARNLVLAQYLLSIGFSVDSHYLPSKLNLAQIALNCAVMGENSCKYTLEVLQLIFADRSKIAPMLSARDQKGMRCLELVAKIKNALRFTDAGQTLVHLARYLLANTPDVTATITGTTSNIMHLVAEYSYDTVVTAVAEFILKNYGAVVLCAMLKQYNANNLTPVMSVMRNPNCTSRDERRELVEIISNFYLLCVEEPKTAAQALSEWVQNTPENLALLDQLLLEFLPEKTIPARYYSIAECMKILQNADGSTFLHQLANCSMPVMQAAFERIFKCSRIELHILVMTAKDRLGANLYTRIEPLPDNELVLQQIQQVIIALIPRVITEYPVLLAELAANFDFFSLDLHHGYIHDLLSFEQYAKLQEVTGQRQKFRESIIIAAESKARTEADAVERRIKTIIVEPMFKNNDFIYGKYRGVAIYLHLQSQKSPDKPELQALLDSEVFQQALTMRAPSETAEWKALYDYDYDNINTAVFVQLKQLFKNSLLQNKLSIESGDCEQNTVLYLAATSQLLPLVRFLVEECGAIVSEDFIVAILVPVANVECLEYIASVYQLTKPENAVPFSAIIQRHSEELFDLVAMRDKNIGKMKWLIQNGADSISLMPSGFNMLQASIGTMVSTPKIMTIKESLSLIISVFNATKDRSALIAKNDKHGFTCLEETMMCNVKPENIYIIILLLKIFLQNKARIDHLMVCNTNILHHLPNVPIYEVAKFVFEYIKDNHGQVKLKQLLDAKDALGRAPLHAAAVKSLPLVKLFLGHGADSSIKDRYGLTALEYCKTYHSTPGSKIYLSADGLAEIKLCLGDDKKIVLNHKLKG